LFATAAIASELASSLTVAQTCFNGAKETGGELSQFLRHGAQSDLSGLQRNKVQSYVISAAIVLSPLASGSFSTLNARRHPRALLVPDNFPKLWDSLNVAARLRHFFAAK